MNTKTCRKCGETKPSSAFRREGRNRDGLRSHCRACDAAYYAANREALSARKRMHYAENRDRVLARQRDYQQRNREAEAARKRRYYERNRDHRIAKQKEYNAQNRERARAWQRDYRHRKRAAESPVQETLKTCTVCGAIRPATADHFVRDRRTSDGLAARCKDCDRSIRERAQRGPGDDMPAWAQLDASRLPAVYWQRIRESEGE